MIKPTHINEEIVIKTRIFNQPFKQSINDFKERLFLNFAFWGEQKSLFSVVVLLFCLFTFPASVSNQKEKKEEMLISHVWCFKNTVILTQL